MSISLQRLVMWRRLTFLAVAVLALAALPQGVQADGLLDKLPDDGAWAQYYCTVNFETPGPKETATVTLRSVGRRMVDEKPQRWIELEFNVQPREGAAKIGPDRRTIMKFSVAEDNFGPGKQVLKGVQEVWAKRGDKPVIHVEGEAGIHFQLAFFFAGPLEKVEKLTEKKSVAWRAGMLECRQVKGQMILPDPQGRDAVVKTERLLKRRLAFNDKVPFGVAEMATEVILRTDEGDVRTFNTILLSLTDMGTDAKSALPDVK
jgi:hypothetical protein